MRRWLPLLFLSPFAAPVATTDEDFAVIGYLPEWRFESANYDVICRHVSHLILFSIEVGAPGGAALARTDRLPATVLREARAAATKHGTKLLLCVGGNGRSAGFSRMARKAKLRKGFLKSLRSFLDLHHFDGVDYNWEYPGAVAGGGYAPEDEVRRDYDGYAALLRESRETLGDDAVITAAYYPDGRQERFLRDSASFVDFFQSMAYDQRGRHSTMDFAEKAIRQAKPFFHHKHALGLPFYGRHVATGDWTTYEDLLLKSSSSLGEEEEDLVDDVFFNDVGTIQRKVRLAIEARIGGVMIWEVGQDCRLEAVRTHVRTCPTPEASLLVAITDAILTTSQQQLRGPEELR
mmetsp:Transcript_13163/g.42882  ORF Transcript_13163/g.42882 Transcript_13163/m.42882 type:complete len:349 (+) Transcript_13163:124-1170(+)